MDSAAYKDEIRFKITGGILEMELGDAELDKILNASMREIQRYICSTSFVTVPYEKCIDTTNIQDANGNTIKINSIARIYRAEGFVGSSEKTGLTDPMAAAQWQILTGTGNLYNFQDYMYNYTAWNTMLQIRNTTSTDIAFIYDKSGEKLYINEAAGIPLKVTIEYIPRYDSIEDITSDYWIDILVRMGIALTKITLGRIRTRYTQSNALWTQDGESILAEGNEEYKALQEFLDTNTQLCYPRD